MGARTARIAVVRMAEDIVYELKRIVGFEGIGRQMRCWRDELCFYGGFVSVDELC